MTLVSDPRARQVVEVPVAEEMSDSFLAYGLSVITARALPDVRDGLKPVQRRILWAMLQMGMRPGSPFRKSARIVGDTMGRYHPHGDAAIYDALVRLGQDFNRRVPLVDPQGNFGSLDDPPAAARYTECRLSKAAMDIVGEVEEDTVDFLPTYDGEGFEPSVLPAAFPNLLVNGTAGIAVGMATNMTPHNLGEIGAAVELVLDNRERNIATTTDELIQKVPGPDFPAGGRVVDQGLRQVHESGRGPVRVQARTVVEKITKSREAIVVTELPYQVGAEKVIAQVTKLADAGRLTDVASISDLTDAEGLRIQVSLKPGADAQVVLTNLRRFTSLEETFHVNNVVLVNGVPTTIGLRELCDHYIDHRLNVIVRRTQHRSDKARHHLEVVDGLLTALNNIDEIVALIRQSQNPSDARQSLIDRFDLTDIQATHILDMPLRRLTSLEKQKLIDEAETLRAAIDDYEQILASDSRRLQIVRTELRRVVEDHNTPRQSEIVSEFEADGFHPEPDVVDSMGRGNVSDSNGSDVAGSGSDPKSFHSSSKPTAETTRVETTSSVSDTNAGNVGVPAWSGHDIACEITLSTSGYLGRSPVSRARRTSLGHHDLLAASVITSTAAPLALITSKGRAFVVRAGEAADAANRLRGAAVAPMLGLADTERVLALVTSGHERLVVVTEAGMVRRLSAETVLATRYGDPVIDLKSGDRIASAFLAADADDIVIVADNAKALRTTSSNFPLKSRGTYGVIGMRFVSGVSVVAGGGLSDGVVVMATDTGRIKATRCNELVAQSRGGRGVLIAKLADGEKVTAAVVVATNSETAADLGLLSLKVLDDDSDKVDPYPVAVQVAPTERYAEPTPCDRRIVVLAPRRR